jgi:hypothetical protein
MRLPFSFADADLSLAPPLGGPNPYWIEWRVWMSEHYEIPIALIIAYLAMVWQGQLLMSRVDRGFNLSLLTVAWNWALSLFSAVGFYHVARAFVASSMAHGVLNPGGVLCRCLAKHPPHNLEPLIKVTAGVTFNSTITGWRCFV